MSLARDVTTVGGGTLMSRLLAYLRDAWIAALLGAGAYSEAFFVVLQVVNFFRRLLSEGALNSAFVPIWLKLRTGDDGAANANRFTWRVLLAMFSIAGFIALLVIFIAPGVIAIIAPGFDRERRSLAAFFLFMKGACSGCPSSTATLKHGIQNLLRHFVPDVVEVRPM